MPTDELNCRRILQFMFPNRGFSFDDSRAFDQAQSNQTQTSTPANWANLLCNPFDRLSSLLPQPESPVVVQLQQHLQQQQQQLQHLQQQQQQSPADVAHALFNILLTKARDAHMTPLQVEATLIHLNSLAMRYFDNFNSNTGNNNNANNPTANSFNTVNNSSNYWPNLPVENNNASSLIPQFSSEEQSQVCYNYNNNKNYNCNNYTIPLFSSADSPISSPAQSPTLSFFQNVTVEAGEEEGGEEEEEVNSSFNAMRDFASSNNDDSNTNNCNVTNSGFVLQQVSGPATGVPQVKGKNLSPRSCLSLTLPPSSTLSSMILKVWLKCINCGSKAPILLDISPVEISRELSPLQITLKKLKTEVAKIPGKIKGNHKGQQQKLL